MRWKKIEIWAAALFVLIGSCQSFGCGPYFPNVLLTSDGAVLVAPEANFERELERMNLIPSRFRALPATNDHFIQTVEIELADLRTCLAQDQVPNADTIIRNHQIERALIGGFREDYESLRPTNSSRIDPSERPVAVAGLPSEFADYFRGSIAWHEQRIADARAAWTSLLRSPAETRHFKSTWAAYMLGKSWEDEDRAKAISCFQNVRALAKLGFADSLGLASASLGWEARLHFRDGRYAAAIDLYLEQAAAGDRSAIDSLRFAASRALERGNPALRKLAAHPRAQRVVTAYVISGGWRKPAIDIDSIVKEPILQLAAKSSYLAARVNGWHTFKPPVKIWLEAVESAKVRDVDSAEQLALAAYQAGEMEMAQRWIKLSRPDSITAQWIQAKLLMHDGNIDGAAALLSHIAKNFPLAPADSPPAGSKRLDSNLFVELGYPYEPPSSTSAAREALGELGALHLRRREFVQALDALLRAHFGLDADYIAECVLTVDELKTYVDRVWSSGSRAPEANSSEDSAPVTAIEEHIREVLARRLTRANRLDEARVYYPASALVHFDPLRQSLQEGYNSKRSREERAQSLWQAARIVAEQGRILYAQGTGPDGHYDWSLDQRYNPFDFGASATNRLAVTSPIMAPTTEEKDRLLQNLPQPTREMEFLYVALSLAWSAAELMPNNSDQTADVLFTAGSWIKNRDAKQADRFYKALVRRCRNTELGAEADRKRWFPKQYVKRSNTDSLTP